MFAKNITEKIVESLNQAADIDYKAIAQLISCKVNCSKELMLKHPTLAVHPELDSQGNQIYTVSVLALINCVINTAIGEKIAAVYCDDETIDGYFSHFDTYTEPEADGVINQLSEDEPDEEEEEEEEYDDDDDEDIVYEDDDDDDDDLDYPRHY